MKTVFGPIDSWRLGKTLGVDMVSSDRRYCSFDCTYCPHSKHTNGIARRRWFVGMSAVQALLEQVEPGQADCITFTGTGEPTLASNLGEAIDLTKSLLRLPVTVLTNSSLIPRDDVRAELAKADTVVAKLDAPDEDLFQAINRPFVRYSQAEIVEGLREFRRSFTGKLVLQMTFVEMNKPVAYKMAALAHKLSPDEVQLNTPWPCSTEPLMAAEMEKVVEEFVGLNVISVHGKQPTRERSLEREDLEPVGANTEVMLMAFAGSPR